jgi:hypothetical protein
MICKGCGAEIKWIKTGAGKHMPIDAVPVKVYVKLTILGEESWRFVEGFVPHWATCLDADKFRRKRGKND